MNIKKVYYDKSKNSIMIDTKKGKGILKDLKNSKKLKFLIENGIEIDQYPEEMIKLLLDGDYKNELIKYKSKVLQLAHEILEKKIKYTKIGVQTNLYKIIANIKKEMKQGGSIKKKKGRTMKPVEKKEENTQENNHIKSTIQLIKEYLHNGEKQDALNILINNIDQTHPLYFKIYSYIMS